MTWVQTAAAAALRARDHEHRLGFDYDDIEDLHQASRRAIELLDDWLTVRERAGMPLDTEDRNLDELYAFCELDARLNDDDPCPCGKGHCRSEHGYDPR